jgi:hypothetical protein
MKTESEIREKMNYFLTMSRELLMAWENEHKHNGESSHLKEGFLTSAGHYQKIANTLAWVLEEKA